MDVFLAKTWDLRISSYALGGIAMALKPLLALMVSSGHCLEPCCRAFQNDTELREAVRQWQQEVDTWQG